MNVKLGGAMKHVFSSLLVIMILSTLDTAPAIAQNPDCIWKCTCEGQSCGCSRVSPGAGAEQCETGSNGCAVNLCDITTFYVAPTGEVFRRVTAPSSPGVSVGLATATADADSAPPIIGWEEVSPGHLVLRNCAGLVIARYWDNAMLRRLKASSEMLSL